MASGQLPPTEQPEEGEAGGAGGRGDSFLDQFLRRLDSDVDHHHHHHHHHQESSPPASPSLSSSCPAPVPSSSASLHNPSSSSSISQPNSWHFLSSSDPATAYINPALLGISGGPSGGLHPALDEFPWILEEFDHQRASLLPGQPSVARLVGDHPDAQPDPGQRLPYIINVQPYNLPPMMNLQALSSSSYDHQQDDHLLLHNRRREQQPIHPSAAGPSTTAGRGGRSSPARGSGGYGALQAGYPSTPKEEPGLSYNTRTSSSPIHMSRAATAIEAAHESSTSASTVVRRGTSQRGGHNSGLTPTYGLDQSLQGSLQTGDVAEPVPRFERDVVVPGGVELMSQPPGRVRVSSGQFMESPGPMQMTTRPGRGGAGAGGAPASNSSVMLGEVNIIGGSAAGGTSTATSVGTPNTTTSSMSSGGSMSDAGDEEETEQDVHEGGSVERSKEAPGASSGKKRKTPEPSSAGGVGGGDEGEDSSVKSESDTKKSPTTTNRPRKRGGAKRLREPRYAIKTRTEVDVMDDGFKWRKYGQKAVKNSPHPRNYYRCTTPQCPVRKRVERSNEDSTLVITTYEGTHTHQTPGFHRSASSAYFGDRPMFLNPGQMSPLGPGSPFLPLPPGFEFTPQQAAALRAGQNPQSINQPMSFQGLSPQQIQSAQARLGFQQDMSMLRAHQYLGLQDHPGTPGPVKLEPFQFTTQQNLQQLRGGHGPTNPPGLLSTNFPGTRQFQGAGSGRDSPTGASGSSQLQEAGGSAMRRSSPSQPQGSPQAFTILDQFNNLPPTMMSSRTSASSPRSHPHVADTDTRISDHTLLGTFMQGSNTSTGTFGRDPGGLMSSQQEQMEQIRAGHQVPLQPPVGGDRPRGSTSTSSREALQDQQLQADHEGLLQDMVRPGTGGPGT